MIDTVTAPTPIEVVTPLKASEAIRLGCLVSPVQLFEDYISQDRRASCVYGAMALGFGLPDGQLPLTVDEGEPCPACDLNPNEVLFHLNDDHLWTRERIADWLEGLGL